MPADRDDLRGPAEELAEARQRTPAGPAAHPDAATSALATLLGGGNRALAARLSRQECAAPPEAAQATPGVTVATAGGRAVRAAIQQATTPDEIAAIITELRIAAAAAPTDRTEPAMVLIGGPTQIASYEARLLLDEAERAAGIVATTSRLPSGADPGMGNAAGVRAQLAQARALAADPNAALTAEQRASLLVATAAAEARLAAFDQLSAQGQSRQAAMVPVMVSGGAIVADDATGVGVADDPLLILVGIAALAVIIATSAAASDHELDASWRRVGESLRELGEIGTGIAMAVQGPRAAGQLTNIARHLARLLALGAVGGVPSGEPPKNNNDDDPHWWSEIKGSVRQFLQAVKGASRKQIMRELTKLGFTEAQVLEIEAALARAAAQMGETIGNLLPPP